MPPTTEAIQPFSSSSRPMRGCTAVSVAGQDPRHRGVDRSDEKHNGDDDGGVYPDHLGDLFIVADGPYRASEGGHL